MHFIAPNCVQVYSELYFFILAIEFESVETSPGFALWISALLTYILIFFVKTQHSVLNFCHLTIFLFQNHEYIGYFVKEDWKWTKNLKTYSVLCLEYSTRISNLERTLIQGYDDIAQKKKKKAKLTTNWWMNDDFFLTS